MPNCYKPHCKWNTYQVGCTKPRGERCPPENRDGYEPTKEELKPILLIKCQLDERELDGNGDSIMVETEAYTTIEGARKQMRKYVLQLVDDANKFMQEDLDDEGNPLCLEEGEDYEIKEDSAWLAWPYPRKWKIVRV